MTNKTRTKLKKMNFMSRDRRVDIHNDTNKTMVSIATETTNEKLQATTRRSL